MTTASHRPYLGGGSSETPEPDLGLFGPGSVTWRVHVEPILLAGGIRALYLQALHPQAMRATRQNSALFDPDRAWARFQRTAEFVQIRTFGTNAEVEQASRRIRWVHGHLRGYDPDTGTSFPVDREDLLLWVHCAEIDSYLDVARRAGILSGQAEVDAYVAESHRAAEVVGIPAGHAPGSLAALQRYFRRVRPALYACDEARQSLVDSLSFPVPLPRLLAPLKMAMPAVLGLGFALLPRWARRLYGAPGLPTTDLAATTALRVLRGTLTVVPNLPAPPEIARARDLLASHAGGNVRS